MSVDPIARIEALEAKVAELYRLVGHPEPDGAPVADAQNTFPPEVVELTLAGDTIQAIRVLRERTGLGLAEAKAVVDRIG